MGTRFYSVPFSFLVLSIAIASGCKSSQNNYRPKPIKTLVDSPTPTPKGISLPNDVPSQVGQSIGWLKESSGRATPSLFLANPSRGGHGGLGSPEGVYKTRVWVINATVYERCNYAVTKVPFPRGYITKDFPSFHIRNRAGKRLVFPNKSVVLEEDTRYQPDEAHVKTANLYVPLCLPRGEQEVLELVFDGIPNPEIGQTKMWMRRNPFKTVEHPVNQLGGQGWGFALRDDLHREFTQKKLSFSIGVRKNGFDTKINIQAEDFNVVAANDARRVLHSLKRVRDFVLTLYLYVFSGEDKIRLEAAVIGSNPKDSSLHYFFDTIRFAHTGAGDIKFHGINRMGFRSITNPSQKMFPSSKTEIELMGKNLGGGHVGFGQGQPIVGLLSFSGTNDLKDYFAARIHPLIGGSLDWNVAKAYGIFGTTGKPAGFDLRVLYDRAVSDFNGFMEWLNPPTRLSNWESFDRAFRIDPQATGTQKAFAVIGGQKEAVLGFGPTVWDLYFTALEEWRRPGRTLRENDGSIVRKYNHPDAYMWNAYPHKDGHDRFGKLPNQWNSFAPDRTLTHEYMAADLEHADYTHLMAARQHYESFLIQELVEHLAEEYLLSFRPAPDPVEPRRQRRGFYSGEHVPRIIARMMYSAVLAEEFVPGRRIIDNMIGRARTSYNDVFINPRNQGEVKNLKILKLDGYINGKPSIGAWMEQMAVTGFMAMYLLTHEEVYHEIARLMAGTMHHYYTVRRDQWNRINFAKIAYAYYWQNGVPLTSSQKNDPYFYQITSSSGLSLWGLQTQVFAAHHLNLPANVKTLAREIYEFYQNQRNPNHPFDDFGKFVPVTGP